MNRKSTSGRTSGKIIRKTAAQIPAPTPGALARLRHAAAGPIDTSDLPEGDVKHRPRIGDGGGLIRSAIVAEMTRQRITAYKLWKLAAAHCATLPNAAVYQFLHGQRQVQVNYADAMLAALGLTIKQPQRLRYRSGRA